jgi:peptide alpha-N-acetyltransferase
MNDSEKIEFVDYSDESMLNDLKALVAGDLSEPYSVFTYRYFLHNWPKLCICVYVHQPPDNSVDSSIRKKIIGTIVCKLESIGDHVKSGYIAMLAVDKSYRKRGIGMKLVNMGIERMIEMGCREIVLETEVRILFNAFNGSDLILQITKASNLGALSLYTKLGFIKEEKLARYYLNGGDAYRLKLSIDKVDDCKITDKNS